MRIGMMVCLLLLASPAWADRVALVIGNAGYSTSPLANPLRDARAVEAVLKELGFSVTRLENAGRSQMMRGVQGFRERLRAGGIGFFYYSGHGVEIGGKNYLLPVGTVVRTQEDVLAEALDARYVVAQMEAAGSQLNLVVLDACRDNPLPSSSKSAGKGLGRMEGGAGTLIAFATAAGQTAADGSGDNSPYTQVLVEQLRRSDLSVSELFNETNLEVARRTRNQQRPWYSTSGVPTLRLASASAVLQRPVTGIPAGEGELRIEVSPATAMVRLDGALLGTGSRTVREAAGQAVVVSAEASGYERQEERVRVQGGQVADVLLRLTAKPAQVAEPPPGRPLADAGAGTQPSAGAKMAAGQRFRDCPTCPEMVVIPSGSFMMGSSATEQGRYDPEDPQHRVQVASFAMGRTEVTFDEYDRFAKASNRELPSDQGWGRGERPVINVSWEDANAYAQWLSAETGQRYRLPSEAEWEYATRAGTSGPYSLEGVISPAKANYDSTHSYGGSHKDSAGFRRQTVLAGSLPANPWGLHEVHGNVFEWVADCWVDNYGGAPSDGSAWVGGGDCGRRVVRGGSWANYPGGLRSAFRDWDTPTSRSFVFGFRLARTL